MPNDEGLQALVNSDPTPEGSAVMHERDERIHAAIASLPQHQQEVVVMHYLEGLPVQDVAGKLGVPQGTVLSRLARARAALRRKWPPMWSGDEP